MNQHLATLFVLLAFTANWDGTVGKSLESDTYYKASNPVPGYQQTSNPQQYPQHQAAYQSPTYPEYDENMESYEYPSSEEIMPVKNSQYVPVELPGESDYNSTGGYVPQQQVSLQQQFWQSHMLQQNYSSGNSGVTDEGNIELVSIPNSDKIEIFNGGAPLSQYYQEQQQNAGPNFHQQEQQTVPTSSTSSPLPSPGSTPKTKKSNVHKLVVVARKTGDGKIAVVKDKLRAARERRSMMTLSREDENDSEYDDLEIMDKTKASKNSTTKATAKPKH